MKKDKLVAAQCGEALLKYLETLAPDIIAKMRSNLVARGQKAEESRDWQLEREIHTSTDPKIVRTRTGYCYR